DKLIVKNLQLRNTLGADAWELEQKQPLLLDITAFFDVGDAAEHDLLTSSVSYATIAKHCQKYVETNDHKTLESVSSGIALVCLSDFDLPKVTITVRKPRGLLHAKAVGIEITRTRDDLEALKSAFLMSLDLSVNCIVGVFPWERAEKQRVVLNLSMFVPSDHTVALDRPKIANYRTVTRAVQQYVEQSTFKTVEALALGICNIMTKQCHIPKVTVRLEKPSAITFATGAGIEMTRTAPVQPKLPIQDSVVSYLAIGSNLGDRVKNMHSAIRLLQTKGIQLLETSFLYESAPMYVTDQPSFLNGALKVKTALNPHDLLKKLKEIEEQLGRDFAGIKNGPRPIDLDILYYGELEMQTEDLVIPHPRLQEREFVLRPLADIAPTFEHPHLFRNTKQLLGLLEHTEGYRTTCVKVLPIRNTLWKQEKTFIMGILNVTPDSFSDGGKFNSVESAVQQAQKMIADGTDIIDIGGQSTRPNAPEITSQEEMDRILPVIRAIRAVEKSIPISVDTFRADVAASAIEAGADLINDVSGGTRDPKMLQVMAEKAVPVCLMHMRGDSKTMTSLTNYEGDVVGHVRKMLVQLSQEAQAKGVYRWNITVDPGIGFAKDFAQNYDLISNLKSIGEDPLLRGLPLLLGVSRKAFIGKTIDQPQADQRVFGTAAACTACIANGANILRVHDVKEMRDVALVADKCFK
ncbi:Dihydropteroate synthase-like protein, partial [Gorgonomyces haynaldii]